MTRASQILAPLLVRLSGILALVLFVAGFSAEAQAGCTAIGSSTFCGTRGSHNTVGRTVIFNTGPAGQRIGGSGGFISNGNPGRVSTVVGGRRSNLALPRTFRGVGTRRTFARDGITDSRITALRAEILALEAQAQLLEMERENLGLTPAEREAWATMPPALRKALRLSKMAEAEAAGQGTVPAPTAN